MSKDDARIVATGLAALVGNNKFTLAQACGYHSDVCVRLSPP